MRCAVIRDDVCVGIVNWDGVGPSNYELEELRTMDDVSMPATELIGKTVAQFEALTQTKLGAPGVGIPSGEDAAAFEGRAQVLAIKGAARRLEGEEAARKEDSKSTDNRSDREFAHHEPTATSASSIKEGPISKTASGHRVIDPETVREDRVFVSGTADVVTRKVEVRPPEPRFEAAPKPSHAAKAK